MTTLRIAVSLFIRYATKIYSRNDFYAELVQIFKNVFIPKTTENIITE